MFIFLISNVTSFFAVKKHLAIKMAILIINKQKKLHLHNHCKYQNGL